MSACYHDHASEPVVVIALDRIEKIRHVKPLRNRNQHSENRLSGRLALICEGKPVPAQIKCQDERCIQQPEVSLLQTGFCLSLGRQTLSRLQTSDVPDNHGQGLLLQSELNHLVFEVVVPARVRQVNFELKEVDQ